MIDKILKRLRGLKTAQQYSEEIPKLRDTRTSLVERLKSLKEGMEDVMFDGGDIDMLNKEIADTEREIDLIDIAIRGVEDRQEAAAKREEGDRLESLSHDIRGESVAMIAEYRAFEEAAHAVVARANAITDFSQRLDRQNRVFKEAGRADLIVRDVVHAVSWNNDFWQNKLPLNSRGEINFDQYSPSSRGPTVLQQVLKHIDKNPGVVSDLLVAEKPEAVDAPVAAPVEDGASLKVELTAST